MDTAELVNGFNSRFNTLIERYKLLKASNEKLQNENAALKQKIEEKESELAESRKQQSSQQLANTFLAASENNPQDAKNKINKIVREIDNCIALLNR